MPQCMVPQRWQKQVDSRPSVGTTKSGSRAAREAAISPSRACASASLISPRAPATSTPPEKLASDTPRP